MFLRGLLCLCLLAPAACWSQDSAQNSNQTSDQNEVATPTDPQQPESAQDANDRIAQLALAETGKGGDYILGPGDLLGIEVFDVPELTRDVRISESGYISLPLLPVKVRAGGLTGFQLQDKLSELLMANGLVSNPQVTISVKEQHGEPIMVIGAVKTPMVIQAVRQMTLLEVLSRVGGIAEDAGGQILVTHPAPTVFPVTEAPAESSSTGAQASATPVEEAPAAAESTGEAEVQATHAAAEPLTVRIDLRELLESGDPKYNIALRGGDVVSVPRAGVVYAVGAVQRPGGFVMASDRQHLTVLKVLALSGGLTTTAKKKNAVIIRQATDSDQRQVPVDLERILAFKSEDMELQQSDILFVPDSASRQVMSRVAQTALGLASGVALVRLSN
jgi:polysaccharide export outer membrane protein